MKNEQPTSSSLIIEVAEALEQIARSIEATDTFTSDFRRPGLTDGLYRIAQYRLGLWDANDKATLDERKSDLIDILRKGIGDQICTACPDPIDLDHLLSTDRRPLRPRCDFDEGRSANITDALFHIGDAINRVAEAIRPASENERP
ncbi:MAG: hypothetical protein ACOC0Q_09025 [Wenzhouxiangella sp.]